MIDVFRELIFAIKEFNILELTVDTFAILMLP